MPLFHDSCSITNRHRIAWTAFGHYCGTCVGWWVRRWHHTHKTSIYWHPRVECGILCRFAFAKPNGANDVPHDGIVCGVVRLIVAIRTVCERQGRFDCDIYRCADLCADRQMAGGFEYLPTISEPPTPWERSEHDCLPQSPVESLQHYSMPPHNPPAPHSPTTCFRTCSTNEIPFGTANPDARAPFHSPRADPTKRQCTLSLSISHTF